MESMIRIRTESIPVPIVAFIRRFYHLVCVVNPHEIRVCIRSCVMLSVREFVLK